MRQPLVTLSLVAGLLYLGLSPQPQAVDTQPKLATTADANRTLQRQPHFFVPNLGQWEHDAHYVARFGAMTMFLEENGWTFTIEERSGDDTKHGARARARTMDNTQAPTEVRGRGAAVRMAFEGSNPEGLAPQNRVAGVHHYFLGNDAAKWRSNVPLYDAVRYREAQPGVDVMARQQDGHFEYDLLLKPDADLERIQIKVEGIEGMHLDGEGTLVLETALGPVRMPAPPSWEEGPSGAKSEIAVRYVLYGDDRFGFDAPARRPGWGLVVDPGLVWSTSFGSQSAVALALSAQGSPIIAGNDSGSNFLPTTPGAFSRTNSGRSDAFVTQFSPTGAALVYSTYLGGADSDRIEALALDAQGAATVTGMTYSSDFPTTQGAFDESYNGNGDAFVARLSPSGAKLIYSTFLGGPGGDGGYAVAIDSQGSASVAGGASLSFPTTSGAFDTTFNGPSYDIDAFVARLSPLGSSLIYSTYLGGTNRDEVYAVAIDPLGTVTVAGSTNSTDFPTTSNAFDTTYNGHTTYSGGSGKGDVFVTKIPKSGSVLIYSTYIGGSAGDLVHALALDKQGAATVAGETDSINFPTTRGAFDSTHNGGTRSQHFPGGDVFVTRLEPSGSGLVYSTFLGGVANEAAHDVVVDSLGAATITGHFWYADFPSTPGAFDTTPNGKVSVFVSRLSPSGARLVYSTFLGGSGQDYAYALELDAHGVATVAGVTGSSDFPTTPGAYSRTIGPVAAFVTRIDMLPTGVSAFGDSSPGCTGPLSISVTSMPRMGNAAFSLTCSNTPPSAIGGLVI